MPRQRRSRATVDAIVESTARLLVERGYDGATTRRIAERAGVSVGSLYQYFPSRDALVTAVIERHVDQVLDAIGMLLRRLERAPLERAVRGIVEMIVALHDRDPGLHSILMEQLPRADRAALIAKMDRALSSHFRGYLARNPDIPSFDIDRAMRVLGRACFPVIHARDLGSGASPDQRADDLFRLILGYVRTATSPPP